MYVILYFSLFFFGGLGGRAKYNFYLTEPQNSQRNNKSPRTAIAQRK